MYSTFEYGTCIAVYACRGLISYFGFLFTLWEYYNRFSVKGKKKTLPTLSSRYTTWKFYWEQKKKKKIGIKGNLFNLLYIYSTFSVLGVSRGFVSECLSLPWLLHCGSGSGAELRRPRIRLGRMVDRAGRRFS